MKGDLHPTRYFDATTSTLAYLLEERDLSDDEAAVLVEASKIVATAESDIFNEMTCPDCGELVHGTDGSDVRRRLDEHREAIHRRG